MFKSTPFTSRAPGAIDLNISDPVLLLNEIARRYETTERILMEYVDNALDDAAYLYRDNQGAYPYPIAIDVALDEAKRTITVRDNCRGMTRETLQRVVQNVGESEKRGVTWVNGRFGFGIHAFRAAAESIAFQTKNGQGSHFALELRREQHHGIKEARRLDAPFPADTGTGTIVTLGGFQSEWLQGVSVASIRAEIENHFERILARPNLRITVAAAGGPRQQCRPFSYDAAPGPVIRRRLKITYKDTAYPVEVYLKVGTDKKRRRPVSFFARERRIGAVSDVKSFMRKSVQKTGVWRHPNLLGYIEVGDLVEPILNRDDFVRTRRRTLLYEAILPIESEVKEMLAQVNRKAEKESFSRWETAVAAALSGALADATAPLTPNVAAPHIQFTGEMPAPRDGGRIYRQDDTLYINTTHPDFQKRVRYTRQGQPRPTPRLNAYLALLISGHYLAQYKQDLDLGPLLAMQSDFFTEMEETLRQEL